VTLTVVDSETAITAIELLPVAGAEPVRRIDTGEEGVVDAGEGELAAAATRLRALPLPAGEHRSSTRSR
jgi:hypothetical protein